jgi:hypothetical protein
MSKDHNSTAPLVSLSGLAGPSGGSYTEGTYCEEVCDDEAEPNRSTEETDDGKTVGRRSTDRIEERVERGKQDFGNEPMQEACTHAALALQEKEECVQMEQGNSVCDGQSAIDLVTDVKLQGGVAANSSLGSDPGETVSERKRGMKRKLALDPVITKSGRVVKKTAMFEVEVEQEEGNPRKAEGQRRAAAAAPKKMKKNEGRQQLETDDEGPPAKWFFLSGVYSDSCGKEPIKLISLAGDVTSLVVDEFSSETTTESVNKKARLKLKWPQPVYFGEFLMKQDTHFQLPYDVWWQSNNNKVNMNVN